MHSASTEDALRFARLQWIDGKPSIGELTQTYAAHRTKQ
jgi:hypothetical protein